MTFSNVTDRPAHRPLKIFAGDPMLGRLAGNRIVIDVANEPLQPGPVGARVEVIDYDGAHQRYYHPVDLEQRELLMQRGLEPSESDPRFHQQMVYAVAMKTLENFDLALGRQVGFRSKCALRLHPHGFHGANAFYAREQNAILFGYFRADTHDPGANLPGQTVYTCLSHDIIVHEMTHAIVDNLREYFLEPTNRDVLAFHEGFSDIVAMFQHFTFSDMLKNEIQRTRSDLRRPTLLASLAQQFGYATGSGKALRSALETRDPTLYATQFEPHARGALLVGAVFDAFFETYQRRIRDLVRIATAGTGNLPDGDLHPDLVNRIADEAARTAQNILTMCIRAIDYLPPVDVTFGDYLRALVTADFELYPEDMLGQRAALIEAFRQRGIYPDQVRSLAEESLLWEMPEGLAMPMEPFMASFAGAAMQFGRDRRQVTMAQSDFAHHLHVFAKAHAGALRLDPDRAIAIRQFHTVFRVAPSGQLVVELVASFVQTDETEDAAALGGVPHRGGTTIVVSGDGRVRYVIAKPIDRSKKARRGSAPDPDRVEGAARRARQLAYTAALDERDPRMSYADDKYRATRMLARMSLSALHGGRS